MRKSDLNLEDILTDHVREDDLLELPLPDRVFRIFFVVSILIVAAVGVQMGVLGIRDHAVYTRRAIANASDVKIIPAPRGDIADRFGNSLVRNESSVNVFLDPRHLPKDAETRADIIRRVSAILGLDEHAVVANIGKADWRTRDRLLLSDDVTQDQLVAISSAAYPGVDVEPAFRRVHEVPFAFSHVLGYTGLASEDDLAKDPTLLPEDQVGRDGLEAQYDTYLKGTNGREVSYRSAQGELKEAPRVEKPSAGDTVSTYIDKDLQSYFYTRMQQALQTLDRSIGAGIAIDPRNGQVLAMVSIPGFDSNKISKYLSLPNQPLFNRAISGVYNPGSTIKPLDAIAGLAEHIITPSTQIYSPGYIDVPNPYHPENPSRFLDWKPQGWVDVYSALARSSNVFFYEVGGGFEKQPGLGITKLNEWWRKFLLDRATGIDLPGEQTGFLPNPSWKEDRTGEPWRLGDTYHVSIGQGDLTVSPIALLDYIAAVANGGTFYQPHIMDRITDSKGNVIRQTSPVVMGTITDDLPAIREAQKGMRDGVDKSYGTSNLLSSLPFHTAAKTGTAQVNFNTRTNAFFVGYAPYENPRIAILVLIENSLEGSHNTIPVAKDVLLWYYENRLKNQPNQ